MKSNALWNGLWPIALCGLVLAVAHCDAEEDNFKRKNKAGPDENDPSVPKCTGDLLGKSYVGFANTKLDDKRANGSIGADRVRMKPYSALKGEYERTIGVTPDSLDGSEASFGRAPDRFAQEPRASAIQLFTAYRVGFDGCLQFVEKDPAFSDAPSADSAAAQCKTMARKFWSRAATDDEVNACAQVALTDSSSEPDPKRRWAYTCASLLSASGFLTY